MKTAMRRLAATAVMTVSVVAMTAGPSLAHVCFNASKPAGAGSAGTATIDVTNGQFTPGDDLKVNPQGRLRGGFVTLTATAGGTPIGTIDTFAHRTLPDPARNAGPGDDLCDGVGIDDAEACLAP